MVAAAVVEPAPPPYDYWPRGGAAEVFRLRDREVLLEGPAGTGKTLACLWKLHLLCLKYPGIHALMVRKTLTALTGSAMVAFQSAILGSKTVWTYALTSPRLQIHYTQKKNCHATVVCLLTVEQRFSRQDRGTRVENLPKILS